MVTNFKTLNNTEMTKIVGGLLIEHIDYTPSSFTSEKENLESSKEETNIEMNEKELIKLIN